jgi:hypothetical protein
MDIARAQSDIAQHPVIHFGEARKTSAVFCQTGEVSRRKPAPRKRAVCKPREPLPGSTCDAKRDVEVLVRRHFHSLSPNVGHEYL